MVGMAHGIFFNSNMHSKARERERGCTERSALRRQRSEETRGRVRKDVIHLSFVSGYILASTARAKKQAKINDDMDKFSRKSSQSRDAASKEKQKTQITHNAFAKCCPFLFPRIIIVTSKPPVCPCPPQTRLLCCRSFCRFGDRLPMISWSSPAYAGENGRNDLPPPRRARRFFGVRIGRRGSSAQHCDRSLPRPFPSSRSVGWRVYVGSTGGSG